MKDYLDKIRKPEDNIPIHTKVMISTGIAVFGFLVGILQKWLDSGAINELPMILQQIDIVNFFGRLAIWILLAVIISVYAETPWRASLNTFLFFISMIAGYYIYCNFVLGFLPQSYMMIWIAFSFVSIILAYVCWYAKGDGIPAIIISACILGVLFSQAFLITQGIYMTHFTEVITWLIGAAVLYRKPKEYAAVLLLSITVAILYQLFIPYWG